MAEASGLRLLRRRLRNAAVCVRCDASGLRAADLSELGDIREMDMADAADVRLWIDIHNDAYDQDWDAARFRDRILQHPHLDILRTWFVFEDGVPVGAASAGVYRRNRDVGVGHYIGIRKAYHGRGLGQRIMLFRYHELRALGIESYESETTIGRKASLWGHFQCGFQPKYEFDAWNTPPEEGPWLRRWTALRLAMLYRKWRRARSSR